MSLTQFYKINGTFYYICTVSARRDPCSCTDVLDYLNLMLMVYVAIRNCHNFCMNIFVGGGPQFSAFQKVYFLSLLSPPIIKSTIKMLIFACIKLHIYTTI